MKKAIVTKILYQLLIGVALSFIYMQFIQSKPYSDYSLAWPFAACGGWFLLIGWFSYLKLDNLSIFHIDDKHKKMREEKETKTKFKMKTFFDYVNTPLQGDTHFSAKEKSLIKVISNLSTAAIFFILACLL